MSDGKSPKILPRPARAVHDEKTASQATVVHTKIDSENAISRCKWARRNAGALAPATGGQSSTARCGIVRPMLFSVIELAIMGQHLTRSKVAMRGCGVCMPGWSIFALSRLFHRLCGNRKPRNSLQTPKLRSAAAAQCAVQRAKLDSRLCRDFLLLSRLVPINTCRRRRRS